MPCRLLRRSRRLKLSYYEIVELRINSENLPFSLPVFTTTDEKAVYLLQAQERPFFQIDLYPQLFSQELTSEEPGIILNNIDTFEFWGNQPARRNVFFHRSFVFEEIFQLALHPLLGKIFALFAVAGCKNQIR